LRGDEVSYQADDFDPLADEAGDFAFDLGHAEQDGAPVLFRDLEVLAANVELADSPFGDDGLAVESTGGKRPEVDGSGSP
jgi:hypothetical protein